LQERHNGFVVVDQGLIKAAAGWLAAEDGCRHCQRRGIRMGGGRRMVNHHHGLVVARAAKGDGTFRTE
jgi:hypothetical protein